MTKTVCDICGKEMDYKRITNIKFYISSNGKIWDVCEECRNALWELIKEKKGEKNDNGRSNRGIDANSV